MIYFLNNKQFESAIILIITVSIFALLIIYIIYSNIRIEKENKVKEKGFYYKKIIELNKEYIFENYKRFITIYHTANSKRQLENLKFDDIIEYYINNNIDGFDSNFNILNQNRASYIEYESKYNKILSEKHKYNSKIINNSIFKDLEKFKQYEQKMIKKEKIKDTFYIKVTIIASYVSPQGRNSYLRDKVYDYYQIKNCYAQIKKKKEYQITTKYQRSLMTNSLRYDVLKRDNFRCQICGASSKDGAKLNVDHIIPIAKGGKTELNNLQTLCDRCNSGKSAKI
ncbi:MAG: HNH endonuclease [Firmicutes bacterium]|nr:HNH endonuclease [Bacillota bacterium]